ncbi:MAG TPA: DsbA family protein [Solirubrobacterales bacterium]|nr:DsbA family protein [Solirubrobacterales bacterium]
MSEICVRITEFTDPTCPWAYSAEPCRHRIDWLYEGRIEWEPRMVVLARTREEQAAKFTPEELASAVGQVAAEHLMPIDTRPKPYVPPSIDACRLVVACRLHADHRTLRRALRSLRIRNFRGELVDEEATIRAAAADAGIGDELEAWLADEEVERALEEEAALARRPMPAARVLDHKLANWSGGRRYSCPSYEITRLTDGVTISIPGFQPFAVYDAVLANLVPGLDRRPPPESAEEVLAWRGFPLATQEVATVCATSFDRAREELGRIATQDYVGADGFWSLDGSR